MKRVKYLLLAFLLVLPITVFAASPNVLTLTASVTGSTVKYDGTMEDGSTAVMCKLVDSSEKEIDLLSSAVDNGSFSGSFENVANGTYNVLCANYEGGEWKKTEVEVKDSVVEDISDVIEDETSKSSVDPTTDNTSKSENPKTYDEGIKKYTISLVVCFTGFVLAVGYIIRRKRMTD